MDRLRSILTLVLAGTLVLPSGCCFQSDRKFKSVVPPDTYKTMASEIEYPAESACTQMNTDESLSSPPPWTIDTKGAPQYWDMSLEEAIRIALQNSRVLRDLGGAVVRSPATTRTAMDPAVTETDPRTGIEAALSAFDAQFLLSSYWEKNDRALNNEFFGGGTRILLQDDAVFQAAITKTAATGTQFTIRHNVDYDANNAPGNLFASAWNTNVEAEIRHPLLQGGGVEFNRIAGPQSTPGIYNGVLIARLNSDMSLSDFEIAVRDLVSNVENAYWDLYYGYRVLDAKVKARDAGLDTWRKIYALYEVKRRGGEADKEAQARSQYFLFQQDVQNALSGEPIDETRNWNGLPSGSFRATGGVLMSERRLRLLMGLPPSDGKLIRPTDEPIAAKVDFDWCQIMAEAAARRPELRREKWMVRRRELELLASKNYLLPKLDAIGRYRWRGFGDTLFPDKEPPLPRFDDAYGDLLSGDFQEWQLGFELNVPIGFRQGHAAERNAELQLSRERAILRDQQREVSHEVADAVGEVDRAYTVLQTSYNRLAANHDQLGSVQAAYEADKAPLDLFLDAQRRVADAETDYYLNRSRYELALKNVHFVKGTLLDYDGVHLAEGPWPEAAYVDAARREASRSMPVPLNYSSSLAPVVAAGVYPQHVDVPAPTNGNGATPTSPEELPTAPQAEPSPDEILPLPARINGASRPSSGPILQKSASDLVQPEVIQTSASGMTAGEAYPIIGAGYDEKISPDDRPNIALRSAAKLEPASDSTTEPASPRRLPSTVTP
ncbi:MAG TPA: TolC family protein [Lacipirellulaceae bacterium]|nr:TolC family protein [Lacipirellulaceae bacterium]